MYSCLQALLIFLIIYTPLAYASVTILPLTILECTAAIIIFLWFLDMIIKKNIAFVKTGFLLPIFAFICVVILQIIPFPIYALKLFSENTFILFQKLIPGESFASLLPLSIYPEATITELLKLLSYLGIFLFIVNKIETKKQLDLIINVIIFFGLLISFFGIIQKLTHAEKIYWFSPAQSLSSHFGPFVNRNNFSGYINMVIPLGLGYFLTDLPLAKRFIYGFSIGIMSLALFMSLSRSGIMVYVFLLILLLVLAYLRQGQTKKLNLVYIWFFLGFCLVIFLMEARNIFARFSSLFREESFVVLGHGYSWLDISRMWRDFPFFGTGFGTFGSISAMYKTSPAQATFNYAHNDYLQLLSETGVVGFSLVALFFIFYFKSVISVWIKRRDSYIILLVLGGVVSLAGMLAYSLLDFNLHIPANGMLFFIIMGLVYRLVLLESGRRVPTID